MSSIAAHRKVGCAVCAQKPHFHLIFLTEQPQ
jgi:hypothetical protein